MFEKVILSVYSPSLTVFLPGNVSRFESRYKFVNFLEQHSYIKGYVMCWSDGT